jgi:hypothetical protein
MFFGLNLPVIVGFMALATEASYWFFQQREYQEIADISAYAGAQKLREYKNKQLAIDTAYDDAVEHGLNETADTITINTPPTSGPNINTRSVEVIITTAGERFFSSIVSDEPVTFTVRAVATYEDDGTACVLALDTAASRAVTVSGSSVVEFAGCTVMSNSVADDSIYTGGTGDLTAPCVRAVGAVDDNTGIHLTACEEIREYAPYVQDPYGNLPEPPESGPCKNVPGHSPNSSLTLQPGRYCSGMTLRGDITLEPGVYVLEGDMTINATAEVFGDGVMFFMADNSEVDWNGNAGIDLSAPTGGTYQGILFFGERGNNTQPIKFNGTADSALIGALYFPSQSIEMLGDFGGSNGCTQIVSKTITFSGNTDFSADCTDINLKDITLAGSIKIVE